jgi:hypothetical protein
MLGQNVRYNVGRILPYQVGLHRPSYINALLIRAEALVALRATSAGFGLIRSTFQSVDVYQDTLAVLVVTASGLTTLLVARIMIIGTEGGVSRRSTLLRMMTVTTTRLLRCLRVPQEAQPLSCDSGKLFFSFRTSTLYTLHHIILPVLLQKEVDFFRYVYFLCNSNNACTLTWCWS